MATNVYIKIFPDHDIRLQNIYGSSISIKELQTLEKQGNTLFYVFQTLEHKPVLTTAAFIAELAYRTDELNS